MIVELLYTSAPQGLKQGSRGFCTVLCTTGLPINLAQRLEALSAYRHLYQPGDARADANPVCHSHLRFTVGGRAISVVSRIAAYGLDYSQRTNKLAHHLVFDEQLPRCGPAAVLEQPVVRTGWDGQCKTLPTGPTIDDAPEKAAACVGWQKLTGDAGWAGVVANVWLKAATKPTWIIFSENQSSQLVGLMREAVALLPEKMRWKATFSTYCTNLPPDVDCKVRCVVAGSDEARMSIARGDVIDLTKKLGSPADSPAVVAARLGQPIGEVAKPAPKPEPIRPQAASAIAAANPMPVAEESLSELEGLDEYLLKEEHVVSPRPAVPNKLPPRPLVAPKHIKAPKPESRQASPVSPVWFIAGAGVLVALMLITATVYMLTRPTATGTSTAQNNVPPAGETQATTAATETESAKLPLEKPPEETPTPQPAPPIKLVCMPELVEAELKDLLSTRLAMVALEGAPGFDASNIKVRRGGQDFPSIAFQKEDGGMVWRGDPPTLKTVEETYDLELSYDLNGTPINTTFKLKIKAGEGPDIAFSIVAKPASATASILEPYALGTELSPKFARDTDTDETEPGKNRKWVWERSEPGQDQWAQAHDKESYTTTLSDLGKQLRLKLAYPTRNNKGETVVYSDPISVMAASPVELPIEKLLSASLRTESVTVKVTPPKLSVAGATMSYGENKIAINKGMFTLPLEKLLVKTDVEGIERDFETLRTANTKYVDELAKWKGVAKNAVFQCMRNELNAGRGDSLTLEAKCVFARQRQTLESFIAELSRFMSMKETDPKTKDEFVKLRKRFVDDSVGYPGTGQVQPMLGKLPTERLEILLEFWVAWKQGGSQAWDDLGKAEQAFFSALSTALTKNHVPIRAQGKLNINSAVVSTEDSLLKASKSQKLLDYELAVQFNIVVAPDLQKKVLEVSPKPVVAAVDPTSAVAATPVAAPASTSAQAPTAKNVPANAVAPVPIDK